MPLVSIIVVTYNCAAVIEECLTSAVAEPDCRVILVDNASIDGTQDIARKFESSITALFNTHNLGYSRANNQAISLSSDEFILLLNPDAAIEHGSVKKLVSALRSSGDTGAVAPMLLFPDGSVQNYVRRFPTVCGVIVEHFVPRRYWRHFLCYRRYTCEDIDLSEQQLVEQPAGAAILFRRGPLLDETFFVYGSDVELCAYFKRNGLAIIYHPQARFLHHRSAGGTGGTDPRIRAILDVDAYYAAGTYLQRYRGSLAFASFQFLACTGILARFIKATISRQPAKVRAESIRLSGLLRRRRMDFFL